MNELIVKEVNFLGDCLIVAQDINKIVWVGISYVCKALGLNKNEKDRQIKNIQLDFVLNRGCVKFDAGIFEPNNATIALQLDYIPLWLAKISITPSMRTKNPDLANKLVEYQLKAKDVLAQAFITPQQVIKELVPELPSNLSPQLQLLINMELKQKEQDQKIHELEDKTDKQSEALRTIKETLLSKMEGEGYNKGVINSINSIAQSKYFIDHAYRYQEVWSESYKKLTEKAGCNLNTLVSNARKRAAENGATKAQVTAICKLSVIASDKRLRELYSAVLKEMLAIYCMEVA